jgi:GT2 family glycosyltransferase
MPAVSVGIVTWNSASTIAQAIEHVRRQRDVRVELLVIDNASTDGTRPVVEAHTAPHERVWLDTNRGFSAAHNLAIARTSSEFYLALNPDAFLEPECLAHLVDALARDPSAGSACGKLLRPSTSSGRPEPVEGRAANSDVIDSTGIVMISSQRHLDRGADEIDRGQYDRVEYVFGASGAAALYRRAMLDDLRVEGEIFDEDFFAYREDADLAWRAQLLGWRCLYVPHALARHRRRVTPERRDQLPSDLNRYSVRNRFLLRLKNQDPAAALRFLVPTVIRDLQVVGYVMLRERTSIGGLVDVVRLLPRTLKKRRAIMARRRVASSDIGRWFREPSRAVETAEEAEDAEKISRSE